MVMVTVLAWEALGWMMSMPEAWLEFRVSWPEVVPVVPVVIVPLVARLPLLLTVSWPEEPTFSKNDDEGVSVPIPTLPLELTCSPG